MVNINMLNPKCNPFFSVVTVTFNAEKTIEKTLKSIFSQKSELYELIIVDGDSTDKTKELLNDIEDKINVFISEPDKGIYDAMNKAINHASGIYVVFMNAGDCFFNKDTLESIYKRLTTMDVMPSLVYGKHAVRYDNNLLKIKSTDKLASKHIKTMPICHQSLYATRELLVKYHFDINLKIVSDYKFLLQAKKDDALDYFFDDVLSIVSPGGISDVRRDLAILEYKKAYGSLYDLSIADHLFYLTLRVKELIKSCVKRIIRYKK